ncbi:MAG: precorrin-3B C(17)-methyltransferase [Moorellaceae bacterium]
MTYRAREALARAEVVAGYRPYLEQIGELLSGKEIIASGMTEEVERCRRAVRRAKEGARVVVVSGGDPGVYGMAGLVLEILHQEGLKRELRIEIIPGVTAATAASAALGAPLMHDFATISLSDRLTPWEVIARRIELAAQADFVLVLYNPRSRGRPEHLSRAREIVLQYRRRDTPVGVVRNVGRAEEEIWLSDLDSFIHLPIDMQATVIIGNSQTRVLDGWMVTPRGYTL